MRLAVNALAALLGTMAFSQIQAVPTASSRSQEAAIISASLPYHEDAWTLDVASRARLSAPVPARNFATAWPGETPSPIARHVIHRLVGSRFVMETSI